MFDIDPKVKDAFHLLGARSGAPSWLAGNSARGGRHVVGATVEEPTSYKYRFHCASCDTRGADHSAEADAQKEGLDHEHEWHPRVFTVEQIGSND
jgi:hypothetical protein